MINYRFSAIIARVDNHTRRSAYLKSSECANTNTPTDKHADRNGYSFLVLYILPATLRIRRQEGRPANRETEGRAKRATEEQYRATLMQGHTHRQTQRPRDPGGSAQSAAADTPRPTNGNCADSQTANHRRQRKINI